MLEIVYKNRAKLFLLTDVIILAIIFVYYLSFSILDVDFSLIFYKYNIILLFLYSLFSLIKLKKNFYYPEIIFLFLFFLFLIGQILTDLYSSLNFFGNVNWFEVNIVFENEIQARAILNIALAIVGFHMVALIFYIHNKMTDIKPQININIDIYRAGLGLLIFSFPFVIYHYFNATLFVINNGYFDYLNLGSKKGLIIYFLEQLFWLGYALILASSPKKSNFILITIAFVLTVLFLKIGTGVRGIVMTTLIMIIWYSHFFYKLRFSKVSLVLLLTSTIFGLMWVGEYRDGSNDLIFFSEIFEKFLYTQGASINTLLFSINFLELENFSDYSLSNIFAGILYKLDQFYRILFSLPPISLVEQADLFGYSGYIITNELPGNPLNLGKSLGTSYITELFLLGREVMQLIGGILVGYIIASINKALYSRHALLLVSIIFPNLIYIPRMSFDSIITYNFLGLFIFVIILITKGRINLRQ